jgi:hypothetical protein
VGDPVVVVAVIAGDTKMLRMLLDADANPNAVDRLGDPATCLAIDHKWVEALELLLNKGPDPDALDLARADINPNLMNQSGASGLALAITSRPEDISLELIHNCARDQKRVIKGSIDRADVLSVYQAGLARQQAAGLDELAQKKIPNPASKSQKSGSLERLRM